MSSRYSENVKFRDQTFPKMMETAMMLAIF